ncbi:type II toxin-antitoxin system death-on-curing family toxin [Acidobacteriota bacterium]
MSPIFLTIAEVLQIHRDQIERYGGAPGVRDFSLLQSAVAMPASTFEGRFLHSDLYDMAAAYLFHITQNHPFIDGNKRVGAVASFVFLSLNGIEIVASQTAFEKVVRSVAEGKWEKAEAAEFFRRHSEK